MKTEFKDVAHLYPNCKVKITSEHRATKKMDTMLYSTGEYVRGQVHTNTIEGAWGLFKRKIIGVHHSVSRKHLNRYCVEFSFSYNHRKVSGYAKFNEALKRCDSRLLYKELIAK